jgi:shikimate kinase
VSARHVALVGLMGAGKSSVGARCAALLDRPLVDTDELVESVTHLTIIEIFEQHGEDRFRELERTAVADACASPVPTVIACGGGAVLDPENRRVLGSAAFVVWLRASAAILATRAGAGGTRPLLEGGNAPATLARLARVREPAYEAAADVILDTDDRAVDDVAREVVAAWRASEAQSR